MRFLPIFLILAITLVFSETAVPQPETKPAATDSSVTLKLSTVDTVSHVAAKPPSDSIRIVGAGRSDTIIPPAGPINPKDSAKVAAAKKAAPPAEPQKMKLLKRKYGGRHQVLLAVFMMIFVAGIVTMAQQWNPR